jgi:peptide deformylase
MTLEIIKWPDPILRQKTETVTAFDQDLEDLSRNMIDTMRAASGIGLAANQVGDLRRIAVVEVPRVQGEALSPYHGIPIVLVNPRIIESTQSTLSNEGCLSLPDTYDTVRRHKSVVVEYQNLSGEVKTIEAEGLMSMCLQHEIDHLDGKTLMEKASRVKKDMMLRRLKKTGNL